MNDWQGEEFRSIDLGDTRLNLRSKQILQKFSAAPGSSINKAFQGWHEIKAAYRFFDNENVSPEKILTPHKEAAISRIKDSNSKIILCVQDTTILDYTYRQKRVEGLGKIRKDHEQGFLLHPTIAFTPDNLCLGVLNYKTWARKELKGKILQRKIRPVEEKESMRWIESYMVSNALALEHRDKLFINIADREVDFYELPEQYDKTTGLAHMIIRAKSDRVVDYESHDKNRKLWYKLAMQPPVGQIEFEIDAIVGKREARRVRQTIRACRVNIEAPRKVKHLKYLRPIEITAVLCKEENPPTGEKAVEWVLLTTLELENENNISALDIANYYRCRWHIELYFKTLKSGCHIEELQLANIRRLENCLAIYMIVAWRILFLTHISRTSPKLSCELFYENNEWKAAYVIARKIPPPREPPTIYEMNRLVASFGGFMNRKCDKEPGIKAIWTGLQRLKDFTLAFELLKLTQTCG